MSDPHLKRVTILSPDNVINSIAIHEAQKINGLIKVKYKPKKNRTRCKAIEIRTVILQYGCDIFSVCKNIQLAVRNNVEQYTSINARRRIKYTVKNLREITSKKGSCMDKFELILNLNHRRSAAGNSNTC